MKGRGKSHCWERMDCYRLGMNERKVVGIGATYVLCMIGSFNPTDPAFLVEEELP